MPRFNSEQKVCRKQPAANTIFALCLAVACFTSISAPVYAQTTAPSDSAEINAKASALDPQDYATVKQVCTVCHGPNMFFHARTWPQWLGIFDQMSGYGAKATADQWKTISSYFQKTLTFVDVNHADEDMLSLILGVNEKTAVAIVAHRADRKFTSVEELEAIPGVDKGRIEQLRPRILFEAPADEE
jgi:DNA uptake protein ComE-like DNA-binding protein